METPAKNGKILLPAVMGEMGDREFISCVMPVREVCNRVQLAQDMAPSFKLSDKLQRQVREGRVEAISHYLHQKERFFNSLVVAVCGGQPTWRGFKEIKGAGSEHQDKIGFLSLSGEETMYALDGQHRLLGLRHHLQNEGDLSDQINVIFICHDDSTPAGMMASRRLFTVLSKNAHKPPKHDIIALDEDDAMAIVTRRLVENKSGPFALHKKIYAASDQFPPNEGASCFTSLGVLYDCLEILFPYVLPQHSKQELKNRRVSDMQLQILQQAATRFFASLQKHIKPFADYHKAKGKNAAAKYRAGADTDHLLFRPLGLSAIVSVACTVYKHLHEGKTYDPELMDVAIAQTARLPMQLGQPPLKDVVWDSNTGAILPKFPLLRQIYQCKLIPAFARKHRASVGKKYQELTGASIDSFIPKK